MADFKKSVDALQFIKDLSMPQQAGKIVKASDAYAPFADQGIFTAPTMADRTIASPKGKLKGGMRFPYLQNVDPAYEGEVWGFGAGNMSTRLLNQFENVPSDKLLLSTILGNKYMHHSNPEVSAELIKHYRKGIKDKKLSNELRDVTNRRINQLTDDEKNPIFAPDSDVTDPAFYRSLDTFDKRAAMGNIMGGVGLNEGTERKRRVANQIFDYEGLMRKMTEPSIIGAPNSSIGSRIFTLSGTKSERPDLNKAYPHVVGGLDLNVDFGQVPFQHYLKDYTDNMMQTRGKVPGWFNLTRSSDLPTQEITDQWLQHLKDRGYADGGQVEHMQAGGVKKAFGALTQLEKEANLARYLEQSVVKDRLYHGTGRDITSFRPNLESGATFLTPSPAFANKFAMDDLLYDSNSAYRGAPSGANVMPVYAQVKNPWDYENPKHIEAVAKTLDPQDRKAFRKQAPTGNWLAIEDHYPSIQQAGFDAAHVMEGGVKNLGVFNQKAIKSALGNRGTYDVTDPDITKAEGGKVEHMQAGGIMPRAGIYYPTSGDERSQAAGLPADFYRKGMTDVASHGYHAGVDVPAGDARLTADLMGSRYVSPQMTRDAINALRLGAEFPVGEGRLRAELMKGLAPNVPTNVGLRYNRPFAEGGSVEHMQAGGAMKLLEEFKALKAAHEAAKATPKLLPQNWSNANLARFLEESKFPRGYHGTSNLDEHTYEPSAITRFNDHIPVWAAKNPKLAEEYAGENGAIYPLHISAKNPLKLDVDMNDRISASPQMQKMLDSFGIKYNPNDPVYRHVNTSQFREGAEGMGHDAVMANERGEPTIGVFSSAQLKSTIGNRGTYDPNMEDIGHNDGGAVHSQIGGMTPEPAGGSARQETFAAQHMAEGGDIMRSLFDHALDNGDIHEMTHAMLVKQHEAEYG